MNLPFEYDRVAVGEFGGTTPTTTDFEHARVVILPVPLDRTTSYVAGTRNGPHEILVASSHMELWDEETETDVHSIGIFTLPEMEFPFATMDEVIDEIRRVASRARRRAASSRSCSAASTRSRAPVVARGGGEASGPVGAADRRARRPARLVHGHAAQPRLRDAPRARVRAGRRRSASAACRRRKPPRSRRCRRRSSTTSTCGSDPNWIDRVVDSLSETVYITIDCDGLDPAIMPAVGHARARRAVAGTKRWRCCGG